MTRMLNLTIKLKQDPQTQQTVQALNNGLFAEKYQPIVDRALRESRLVHFARFIVIDNAYLQVLTEYDGEPQEYTDFFLKKLETVFEPIFGLAEDAPPWEDLKNSDNFFTYAKGKDLPSLGKNYDSTDDNSTDDIGYAFKAHGDISVREIDKALELTKSVK